MLKTIKSRSGVIRELFGFLWKRKMWWLIPMVAAVLVFGLLLGLASVSGPLAPFIYTLF